MVDYKSPPPSLSYWSNPSPPPSPLHPFYVDREKNPEVIWWPAWLSHMQMKATPHKWPVQAYKQMIYEDESLYLCSCECIQQGKLHRCMSLSLLARATKVEGLTPGMGYVQSNTTRGYIMQTARCRADGGLLQPASLFYLVLRHVRWFFTHTLISAAPDDLTHEAFDWFSKLPVCRSDCPAGRTEQRGRISCYCLRKTLPLCRNVSYALLFCYTHAQNKECARDCGCALVRAHL